MALDNILIFLYAMTGFEILALIILVIFLGIDNSREKPKKKIPEYRSNNSRIILEDSQFKEGDILYNKPAEQLKQVEVQEQKHKRKKRRKKWTRKIVPAQQIDPVQIRQIEEYKPVEIERPVVIQKVEQPKYIPIKIETPKPIEIKPQPKVEIQEEIKPEPVKIITPTIRKIEQLVRPPQPKPKQIIPQKDEDSEYDAIINSIIKESIEEAKLD